MLFDGILATIVAVGVLPGTALAQQVVVQSPSQGPPTDPALFDAALAAEMEAILALDQGIRSRVDALGMPAGLPLPDVFVEEWRRADQGAESRLLAIVRKHGWPGRSKVGDKGAMAAFLVIQHAGLETQKEFLPVVEKAAAEGEVRKDTLAYLIDRIRLREGGKQVYGTQIGMDEKGNAVAENLEDPAGVDARRAELGMPPLATYLKMISIRSPARSGGGASGGEVNQALRAEVTALHHAFRSVGPGSFGNGVTTDDATWPPELKAKRDEMRRTITARFNEIMAEHGHPGAPLLGEDGAAAFFYLLPHTPVPTQERALALMTKAAERGEASRPHLAWLTDKLRREGGRPQVYGTQVERSADGAIVACELEEPAAVNDRRASAGLNPIEDYLAALNGTTPGGGGAAGETGPKRVGTPSGPE